MNFLAALERDINVCAILSRLYHRDRKLHGSPYFETHIMELINLCDQDDNADIVCIAVAFMMEAVEGGEIAIGELAQIVACSRGERRSIRPPDEDHRERSSSYRENPRHQPPPEEGQRGREQRTFLGAFSCQIYPGIVSRSEFSTRISSRSLN